jgi:HEAT repeat protein
MRRFQRRTRPAEAGRGSRSVDQSSLPCQPRRDSDAESSLRSLVTQLGLTVNRSLVPISNSVGRDRGPASACLVDYLRRDKLGRAAEDDAKSAVVYVGTFSTPDRSWTIGLIGRKPNVESLARNRDLEGLIEATGYQEPVRTSPENVGDLGIPVRTDAILALGELGGDVGEEAVAAALRDPADRVRCAAVRVLYERKKVHVLVWALGSMPAGNGQSRAFALRAVVRLQELLSPAAVANALIHSEDGELLNEDVEPLVQVLITDDRADAMDELIELLVSSLGDERSIVADRAGELLLRLAPSSVEALVDEVRTGPAAAEAAYVLGRIADPQALNPLVEALGHSDPRVRAESAAALAELQDPAVVKPLLRATHDADHSVRTQAGLALDRLGSAAVIVGVAALLEPMILDAVRSAAGQALAEVKSRQQPARPKSRSRRSNGGSPELPDPPTAASQTSE